ncbi:MAG: Putative membrane protein insertion efficiency factor [Opitutia bacterium UBA7350]|nr:MAG: Putative membrane protein insertion efficiency factor [Opitutae bacterium UBA7350]
MKKAHVSLVALVAALLVRGYQILLSPLKYFLFGSSCGCRFHPTCSAYARDAFLKHGFLRGLVLALGRILRCHPWHPGGLDPVPDLKTCSSDKPTTHFNNCSNG